MAEGILGLGSGQAASLNSDLINKLKEAERKATISPIETRLENITAEKEIYASIEAKVKEFIDSVKPFDLFISKDFNAFEQKAATTSGDSVTFDAPDMTKLREGFTSVNITKLAQKDVYQSNSVNSAGKEATIDAGNLEITVNGTTEIFDTTGKTYEDLAKEINAKSGMSATIEQVGTDSYRLVIKSEESGLDNKLTISGAASTALGLDDPLNNILKAQDLEATVDGVEYKLSSNVINVDGLKITANKEGTSTINISQDNSQIETQMNNFVTKFNELVSLIDSEIFNSESKIADKSAIRDIVSQVKNKLFGTYGTTESKSIFNYGLEIDKSGMISLDSTKFKKVIEEDF
ncbi:MAG: flagellar filament capping protein FliD [Aliarcobacter sp.]